MNYEDERTKIYDAMKARAKLYFETERSGSKDGEATEAFNRDMQEYNKQLRNLKEKYNIK